MRLEKKCIRLFRDVRIGRMGWNYDVFHRKKYIISRQLMSLRQESAFVYSADIRGIKGWNTKWPQISRY